MKFLIDLYEKAPPAATVIIGQFVIVVFLVYLLTRRDTRILETKFTALQQR